MTILNQVTAVLGSRLAQLTSTLNMITRFSLQNLSGNLQFGFQLRLLQSADTLSAFPKMQNKSFFSESVIVFIIILFILLL